MLRSFCDFLTLLEVMTASSANCNQEFSVIMFLGPQMFSKLDSSGFFKVHINVLKHKLNKIGDIGSPCSTPLFIGISDDQLFPNAIFILESSYISLNSSLNKGRYGEMIEQLLSNHDLPHQMRF